MKKLLITIGLLITIIGCEYEEFDPTAPRESKAVKWTDGVVYYKFDVNFPFWGKYQIREAMDNYEQISSLKFIELQSIKGIKYFCIIKEGNTNSCSAVGMVKDINLILYDYSDIKILLHELGHLIGLEHEHQREDRDEHIKINWENIQEGKEYSFKIIKNQLIPIKLFEYDVNSIMHYASRAFSKNNKETITSFLFASVGIHKSILLEKDIKKIQYLYPL